MCGDFGPLHFIAPLADNSADQNCDYAECEYSDNQCICTSHRKQHSINVNYSIDLMSHKQIARPFFFLPIVIPSDILRSFEGSSAVFQTTIQKVVMCPPTVLSLTLEKTGMANRYSSLIRRKGRSCNKYGQELYDGK
jgi:hypothetical protein